MSPFEHPRQREVGGGRGDDDGELVGQQARARAGNDAAGFLDRIHLEFVGAEEEAGLRAFDNLPREGVGTAGVEGDSHARRGTIQAGDLIERVIHARATDTTRPGGCAATDVLNAARTVIPTHSRCTSFVTRRNAQA